MASRQKTSERASDEIVLCQGCSALALDEQADAFISRLEMQKEVVGRHDAPRKEVLRQPTVLLQKVVRVLLVHEDVD